MKPLLLEMNAFGPFAGRERVDFAALGENPLFLVHGPTGSGKSTILDAICVALYGDTAGGERDAGQMRSHHAPDDRRTELVFEFLLGGERYRAFRAPAQERASSRARGGVVQDRARAELACWREGRWHVLAARPPEVLQKVHDLIGLDLAQFRQVVMLPQGRFREVLTAKSGDRERILETLFATEVHRRLQEDLDTQAKAVRTEREHVRDTVTTLLGQRGLGAPEELAAAIAEARRDLEILDAQRATLRERERLADLAFAQARALAARHDEHDAAARALGDLLAGAEEIAAMRRQRDLARRAAAVVPARERLLGARGRLAAASTESVQRQARAGQARMASEQAEARLLALREAGAAIDAQRGERDRLALVAREQDALGSAREQAAAAATALGQASAACVRLAEELSAAERALAEHATRIDAQAEQAAGVAACQAALDRAVEARAALVALAQARREGAVAQDAAVASSTAREQAGQRLAVARDAHARALAAWRSARAAALAATLADGAPCPVCGSRDHPAPAALAHAGADGDDALEQAAGSVREAEAVEMRAADAQARAQTDASVAASRIEEREAALRRIAPDEPAAAQLAGRLAALESGLGRAREAAARLPAERARYVRENAAVADRRTALEGQRAAEQDLRSAAAAARATLDERLARIPPAWRDPQALRARLDELTRAVDAHEAALRQADAAARTTQQELAAAQAEADAAGRAVAAAQEEQGAAQEAFARERAAAGLVDDDAFVAAVRSPAELSALEERVAEHEQVLAAARERLARAVAALAGQARPELGSAQEQLARVRDELDAQVAVRARLQERLADDERLASRLAQDAAAIARLDERYALVGRLADLACGRHERRLTFQRYVLAALLDDVLVLASERLRAMSRGRYWLRRFVEVGDRRAAQGLDIEVFDDDTGRARAVHTLSGGEGFLAALALALGLSDMVAAYAGGIRLETLFVDEGFGSLDPEALDLALRALLDLRAQGRTIGIISHVDELRRQIGARMEVRVDATGSHVDARQGGRGVVV